MEGNKKEATPSFTTDLFGSKESPPPSSAFFTSIFPPPSNPAHSRDLINSQDTKKKYDYTNKRDCLENEDKSENTKAEMSPYYQQRISQPCHLSSSIYYGGQDIYTNPHTTKNTPGHLTQYSEDGEDDGRASRGNWWQGSLYY